MKQHILAALREEYDAWKSLLASLNEAQIHVPLTPSHWTVKDVVTHVWAWQQRSIARVDAALLNQEPRFPDWSAGVDPDAEDSTEKINAWIYETYRDLPWLQVHQAWRDGFQHILSSAEEISERDLLDSDKYPWLQGYPLAFILLATYDHHQEHLEKLEAWPREQTKS